MATALHFPDIYQQMGAIVTSEFIIHVIVTNDNAYNRIEYNRIVTLQYLE